MSKMKAVRLSTRTRPVDDWERGLLKDAGIEELVEIPGDTPEQILEAAKDADIIFTEATKVRRGVIEKLEKCRAICRYGTGVDNIDVDAATELGIMVTNVPDFCLSEMADHTMALLLGTARKLIKMHNGVLAGKWHETRTTETFERISGKTLGLIGFGNVAIEVAKRAQAFGIHVIDYHRNVNPEVEAKYGVTPVSLETLYRESDFIVLLCALTPETEKMIGERELKMMKPNAIIINTSRGALIDEFTLAKALKERWIAGAGIDCYFHLNMFGPAQGIPESPYFELDNILLTPHVGGASREAGYEQILKAVADAKKILNGERPQNLVNRSVQPRYDLYAINIENRGDK